MSTQTVYCTQFEHLQRIYITLLESLWQLLEFDIKLSHNHKILTKTSTHSTIFSWSVVWQNCFSCHNKQNYTVTCLFEGKSYGGWQKIEKYHHAVIQDKAE